jgi:hypothetical protein
MLRPHRADLHSGLTQLLGGTSPDPLAQPEDGSRPEDGLDGVHGVPRDRQDVCVVPWFEVVWSKNSCGLALVVLQEPAEPFSAVNRVCTPLVCS